MKKSVPFIARVFRIYFNTIGLVFKDLAARQLIKLFSTPRNRVVRKREKEVLATAKQSSIKVNNTSIAVYEWGEGTKTAILFHGWESNAGSLGAFVQPLVENNYKVVSFDAPAHGKSKGKQSNLIYFKKTAKFIIEKIGVPDLVIGHSLGANTIIMVAKEEKINFSKAVLISPFNRLMSVFDELRLMLKIPPKLFNRFIEKFGIIAGYEFKDFYFQDMGKQSPLENVLILHDVDDKITEYKHSKEMNKAWPKTSLKSISGSGHYRILWDEVAIESALEFIDR